MWENPETHGIQRASLRQKKCQFAKKCHIVKKCHFDKKKCQFDKFHIKKILKTFWIPISSTENPEIENISIYILKYSIYIEVRSFHQATSD